MRFYLARHGETQWNVERRMQGWGDSQLTETGHAQARIHGQLLQREGVAKIYASDLGRVKQTVERIHEQCDVATEFHQDLRECSMGEWEGQRVVDIQEHPEYARWRTGGEGLAPPKGESIDDIKQRVGNLLQSISAQAHDRVALVTHGITTRVLLDLLVDLTEDQKQALRIPNGVVHMVDFVGSARRIVHFRDGCAGVEGICTSMR